MNKLKKDDLVEVITGKDKNKQGKILKFNLEKGVVFVDGINKGKKHSKKSQTKEGNVKEGGIIDIHLPLSISNIMYVCKSCNKKSKLKIVVNKDNKKERECKLCHKKVA